MSSTIPSAKTLRFEVIAPGNKVWSDSGIFLHRGDRVVLDSEGTLRMEGSKNCGPSGLPRGWLDLLRALPVNSAGPGALIGRIGEGEAATPFLAGEHKELVSSAEGHLFLGINLGLQEQADGNFRITVEVMPVPAKSGVESEHLSLPPTLLDQLPRRVQDSSGTVGDMVNLLLIGSRDQLQTAFADAGWVVADRTKHDAAIHAVLATLSHQAYLELPMSELYLFGRPQDLGFAHAEPVEVVRSRHHLRLWKAPVDWQGQEVWLGAATHDIGFEKDQRNGQVTHQIDPNVDEEREFVGASLNATGDLSGLGHALAKNSVREAHTATGGSFYSDGQILVMILR